MTGIALGLAFAAGLAFGTYAVMAACLIALLLWLARRVSPLFVVLIAMAAILGMVRSVPAPEVTSPSWVTEADGLRGEMASGPMTASGGQRFTLRVSNVRTKRTWQGADGLVCVRAPAVPELHRGD